MMDCLEPAHVDYIEAHGTGTRLGDPIELGALARVFGPDRTKQDPLLVGAVKGNIAHGESAAGVAGVIKTALSLQHESIPAVAARENSASSRITPFDSSVRAICRSVYPSGIVTATSLTSWPPRESRSVICASVISGESS